jgi:hypothetical protein
MTEYYIVMESPHGSDYALFWRANEAGYTRQLDRAGRYSQERAQQICSIRGEEFMLPCEDVDSLAVRVADWDQLISLHRKTAKLADIQEAAK